MDGRQAPDTFAPCGPALTLASEIDDVHSLALTTRLNGVAVQQANTSQMIFTVGAAIAFISRTITLEPGDIIATGTPSGVGLSAKPPVFLKEGDVVEVEIESLGVLRNPVRAESASVAEQSNRSPRTGSRASRIHDHEHHPTGRT